MCGFTCHLFGATYPDAECIDGLMWDLDSYEDGFLTSGGEIPCPRCNTQEYLAGHAQRASEDIPQAGESSPAEFWEATIRICIGLNSSATAQTLRLMKPFEIADWPGRIATKERQDPDFPLVVMRTWPWQVAGLSAHEQLLILPRQASASEP